MVMEVKIISECSIKPSSPTPPHLKTHKMSYLDRFMPPAYVPRILFYPMKLDSTISVEERSRLLKQSLSETLSRFYPLAGRIKDGLSIDCNDEGIAYVRSQVINCDMFMFLSQQPDLSLLQKFVPRVDDPSKTNVGDNVAYVQENVFECGGVAIGVCLNHMVFDGIGVSCFLKCWGAIARGCDPGQLPDFVTGPSLFPQNDAFPRELSLLAISAPFVKFVRAVTKRFVFDSFSLAALKLKAASSLVPNPTRVEVVSGLIWKCAALAFGKNSQTKRPTLLNHDVNLRGRTEPPLPERTIGSFFTLMVAKTKSEICINTDLSQLVQAIREAKANVNSEFLTKREADKGYNSFCDAIKEVGKAFSCNVGAGGADMLACTTWITFGIYEVDFGWGKPAWLSTTGLNSETVGPHVDRVILNETKEGNGIEAWVTLSKPDMAIFECNEELVASSSFNPSPIGLSNA